MTSSPSSDDPRQPPLLIVALALASLSGVLYFVGFVGFGVSSLTWICFVPVLFALDGANPRRTLLIGVVFGAVTNSGGYYWVIHLLGDFAGAGLPVAVLGYVALCVYQGLLLALVIVLVQRAQVRGGVAPVWSLPIAFVALEQAYPLLFPSYIGNALYTQVWLTQIVELTGMLGLTALIGLVNGGFFELVQSRLARRKAVLRRVVVPAVAFGLTALYGAIRIPMIDAKAEASRKLTVGMVQTNLGARDKANRRSEFIRRHRQMSIEMVAEHPEVDLIVWPESAYNRWINRETRNLSRTVVGGIDRPVLFGTLTHGRNAEGDAERFNSAVLTSSTGDVLGMFDKIVLLQFGETLPLVQTFPSLLGVIKRFFPRTSVFTTGRTYDSLRLDDDTKLLTTVCYEDIIPSVVRDIRNRGGPPEALVNITNDSWYGDTDEPLIHLALATFRTIETRRAMIRSTNTGLSAFIDPVGRITQRSGQWTQESLVQDVPMIDDRSTTLYMLTGDLLGWAAVLMVAYGLFVTRSGRRRKR